MSYRRSSNLRDRLVKSEVPCNKGGQKLLAKQKFGSYPCCWCINCNSMLKGAMFIHPVSKAQFPLHHYLTCNTDLVVYLLQCPCNLLYVGETTCDFKVRFNQHRYTIRKGRLDLPVSKHFSELKHSEKDLRFMLLEHVPPLKRGGDQLTILKKKELEWIFKLNRLKPHGLNVEFKVTQSIH